MNLKIKILIISLVLLLVLSVSTVTANDTNDTQNIVEQDTSTIPNNTGMVEKVNSNVQSAQENEIISADDNTYTSLQDLIDNGGNVININKDYTYKYGEKTTNITISKDNIIINGNNHIISGNSLTRAFIITGNNITLNNLIIKNTIIDKTYIIPDNAKINVFDGSAISWIGNNGKLNNCHITDNNIKIKSIIESGFYGGSISINNAAGICWYGENGSVLKSTFTNNIAVINGEFLKGSGAILWKGKEGTIKETTFNNNKAPTGGAVRFDSLNGIITNSFFNNNNAGNGGGIFAGYNVTILNSEFTHNTGENGSGIYDAGINAIISNCTFTNNTCTGYGAAIDIRGDHSIILDSEFINNSADGGSVYNSYGGAVNIDADDTVITTSNFEFNNANGYNKGSGGAIGTFITASNLKIHQCNFTNNTAGRGGSIWLYCPDVTISECDFKGGECTVMGTLIYFNNKNQKIINSKLHDVYQTKDLFIGNFGMTAINCSFYNNTGSQCINVRTNTTVDKCSFINNTLTGSTVSATASSYPNFIVTNCYFANNKGYQTLVASSNNWTITNNVFINNTNNAIYLNRPNATVDNCTIINHTGRGIYVNNINISISNCKLINIYLSSSNGLGAGVYIAETRDNITISNCSFINGTSNGQCGAIYSLGVNLTVYKCEFINNHASKIGGAVSIKAGNIIDCTFINNTNDVSDGGGALAMVGGNVINSTFINNAAKGHGGAIRVSGSASGNDTYITGCLFINNTGNTGGAISRPTSGRMICKYNTFINTTSNKNNGIYAYNGLNNHIVESNWFGTNNESAFHQGTSYLLVKLEKINTENIIKGEWNSIVKVVFYDNTTGQVITQLSSRPVNYTINNTNIQIKGSNSKQTGKIYGDDEIKKSFNITAEIDNQKVSAVVNDLNLINTTSFKDLQNLINGYNDGETVTLNNNYIYNPNVLNEPVVINIDKALKITGDITISGSNQARIFNITADNVEIKDLTLTDAKSNSNGGAIIWTGNNGKITNVKFSNNDVTGFGGAVYAIGNNMNIDNSAFNNNVANDGSSLYIIGDNIIITNTVFKNNKVNSPTGVDVYIKGQETLLNNVTEKDTNNNGIKIEGDDSVITKLTLENINATGLTVDGNNSKISDVTVIGGKGPSVEVIGDNTTIEDVISSKHTDEVLDITGNNTTINNVIAENNTGEPIIKTNGTANIENITANGGNSTIIDATGDNTEITNITSNNHNGDMVDVKGDNVNVENITANNNIGDIVNITGDDANIKNIKTDESEGTIATVKGDNAVISDIEAVNHKGNITNIDGKGAKISDIPAGNPDEVFIFPTNITTNSPTFSIEGLPLNATGNFVVTVDGLIYRSVMIKNGKANITINELSSGAHEILLNYTGDSTYSKMNKTEIITIPMVEAGNPDKVFIFPSNITGNSTIFRVVDLASGATGNFTVSIDGNLVKSVVIINGAASIIVNNLTVGKHNVTLGYTGDSNYKNMSKDGTITIPEVIHVITLSANNITVEYSGQKTYSVKILVDGKNITDGENVTINYNGVNYTVKTANGYASFIPTTTLKIDKYTITATYKGKKITNTVNILNIINAAKLKKLKKSKKVNKVKVSLAKVNGKILVKAKLTLKVKGKKIATAKTSKKGVATFKVKKKSLKKLKPGKAVATVTYGNDILTKTIKIAK